MLVGWDGDFLSNMACVSVETLTALWIREVTQAVGNYY